MAANRTPIDFLSDYDIGDGLKAADINALIGAAKRLQKIFGMEGSGDSDCYALAGSHANFRRDLVPVLNSTGADIPLGGVAQILGPTTIGSFDGCLEVVKVDINWAWRYLVATEGPIPDDGNGWMSFLWEGGGPVLLSTSSVSGKIEWGVTNGQYYLSPDHPGFLFQAQLTIEGSSTYANMVQRPAPRLYGDTSGILQNSTGTVNLTNSSGTSLSLSVAGCLNKGKNIPASDPVFVDLIGNQPFAVGAKEDLIP